MDSVHCVIDAVAMMVKLLPLAITRSDEPAISRNGAMCEASVIFNLVEASSHLSNILQTLKRISYAKREVVKACLLSTIEADVEN